MWKNYKMLKQIFLIFFSLKWAGSGPNTWVGPNLAQMHGLGTVHIVTGVTVCTVPEN